jgi:hypothetical protein
MANLSLSRFKAKALLLLSMLISCKPANESAKISPSSAQIATIALSVQPITSATFTSPDNSIDAGIQSHLLMPNPVLGNGERIQQVVRHSTSIKVSEDGSAIAVWTGVFEPIDQEDGAETRYLLGRRVDDNVEFFRMVLKYPSAYDGEDCPPPPKWHRCSKSVLQERKEREQSFLSAHRWTEIEYFAMDETFVDGKRFQKLIFPNLHIFFDNMTLRLQKPSGETLLKKELPRWHVYIKPLRLGEPNGYSIHFIGIDLPRRVLVAALHNYNATDTNFKFHTFRLPSF